MKIEKLFPVVRLKIVESREKRMLEVINEKIFQVLIIISVVAGDVVENFMIISPNFFPPLGFDKLPDFFSRDFFARNLGKNLFLIKLKIWERNFVVFSLILANDVFEMFQSRNFFWSGGCKKFQEQAQEFVKEDLVLRLNRNRTFSFPEKVFLSFSKGNGAGWKSVIFQD